MKIHTKRLKTVDAPLMLHKFWSKKNPAPGTVMRSETVKCFREQDRMDYKLALWSDYCEKNKPMLRGETEVDTLALNGWRIGDILEGDYGYGPEQILITAIGEELFLCRWKNKNKDEFGEESGDTTLNYREWKKVD